MSRDLEPDEEQPDRDPHVSRELALLGIDLVSKEKKAIWLE